VLEQGGFIVLVGGAIGGRRTVQGVPSMIPEAEMTTVQEAKTAPCGRSTTCSDRRPTRWHGIEAREAARNFAR